MWQHQLTQLGTSFSDPAILKAMADLKIWLGASSKDPVVAECAEAIRDLLQPFGTTVTLSDTSGLTIDDHAVAKELSEADLIAMLAVTAGVSAEALEICLTSDANRDKMIVYMPDRYQGGFIYDRLRSRGAKVKEFSLDGLKAGTDTRLTCRLLGDVINTAADADVRRKLRAPMRTPRLAIVTALGCEFQAMRRMLDGAMPESSRTNGLQEYLHGTIPADDGGVHDVVLTMAGKGLNAAAIAATQLINEYPSVEDILMVGIAAAVPSIAPTLDIRKGDIVLSGDEGVVQYDMIKLHKGEVEFVYPPRPPAPHWLERAKYFSIDNKSVERFQKYVEARLEAGLVRPCQSAKQEISSPVNESHGENTVCEERLSLIFVGTIGSGNTLVRNDEFRDELAEKLEVIAFEMEASGIADAAYKYRKGYFVIRGIVDYADPNKDDEWHYYSSLAAAAMARLLIESMPLPAKVGV